MHVAAEAGSQSNKAKSAARGGKAGGGGKEATEMHRGFAVHAYAVHVLPLTGALHPRLPSQPLHAHGSSYHNMEERRVDAAWRKIKPQELDLRGQFDAVFQTHFRFASAHVRDIWNEWSARVSARDSTLANRLTHEIDIEVAAAFQELKATLLRTHPLAATWVLFGERTDPVDMYAYFAPKGGETYSLARGAWIIGAFGKGNHADRTTAYAAFNKYVRWCAAFLAQWNMRSQGTESAHRHHLGEKIAAHRNLGVETRMRWIAEEICDALGSWVDASLGEKKDAVGSHAMRTMSRNAAATFRTLNPLLRAQKGDQVQLPRLEHTVSEQLLMGVSDETQAAVTAPPQELTDRALTLALQGEVSDLFPLVRVGGRTLVLQRSAWLVERDRSMLNAVMGMAPSDREGEPLEEVSRVLLNKWGPSNLTWSTGEIIAPPNGGDGDETDLLGIGEQAVVIGECKANRLSKNDRSLDTNFEERILNKAASQVAVRATHWKEGWRPPGHPGSRADATGLVVTLSSYAGGVWSEPHLRVDDEVVDVAILPLHSLILATSAIPDATSLAEYLNWRTRMFKVGLVSPDELELVLTFVSQGSTVPEEVTDNERLTFRGYELSANAVAELDPRRFRDDNGWRERYITELWKHSNPASPPF